MINTASRYDFVGIPPDPPPNPDVTRFRQGWGLPDVERLYLMRESFPLIIDESVPLEVNGTATYNITVPANAYALRATLVYRDPPGTFGCDSGGGYCRINDLTLSAWNIASPFDCYWGNDGLMDGNWSTQVSGFSNCSPFASPVADTIDTTENIFVKNPAAGTWAVRVLAKEINADGNVHYINGDPSECIPNPPPACFDPADTTDDAVFALVVSFEMDCDQDMNSDVDQESPPGACCIGGMCSVLPKTCCVDQGGTFKGDKTTCDDCNANGTADVCEGALTGACCLFDVSYCQVLPQCSCESMGGLYIGDNIACGAQTCPAQ